MNTEDQSGRKFWSVGTLTYSSVGLAVLFIWMLWGDFAWQLKDRSVNPVATLMFEQFGTTELVYALIVMSFPNFTNIFLGPIVSYQSDRFRSRFGRRIPFLIFTTPFVVVSLVGLGLVPMLAPMLQGWIPGLSRQLAGLIWFCIFWVMLDFGTTLANSLFGALVNDVVPGKVIGRFFSLFRIVSLLAGILFNKYIIGIAEVNFMPIFIGIGILYGIGLTCICLFVKEGEYPPLEIREEKKSGFFAAAQTYFKESYSVPFFLWVMAAGVLSGLVFRGMDLFAVLYVKRMGLALQNYGDAMAYSYVFSMVFGYPLGMLADRFHPIRMSIAVLILYVPVALWGFFCADNVTVLPYFLLVHTVLAGAFWTVSASYTQKLFPRALYAQFASAQGLISAIVSTLFPLAIGGFLDLIGRQYRYLNLIAIVLALISLALLWVVYRYYRRFGGDRDYQPPCVPGADFHSPAP